jgi:Ca-activated chloride channel family protein
VIERGRLIAMAVLTISTFRPSVFEAAVQQGPIPSFKSGVDLVRVSAIVRDHKGRFVPDLKLRDFEVFDDGRKRPIVDFRADLAGVSIAMLLDISGSMQGLLADAREGATHLLKWLQADRDEAAVFTFDTQLIEVEPFTRGLQGLPDRMAAIRPFGATSLHDAIAQTAQRLGDREGRRRGVVVFTDGRDNWSRMKPEEVAAVANRIDVPVYIVGIVTSIDNPTAEIFAETTDNSPLAGPLKELAMSTGGRTYVASTSSGRSLAARQLVDELRHQYLIAFESSGTPGWHPLVIRAHGKDLIVRARNGYIAGQSRPNSSFD